MAAEVRSGQQSQQAIRYASRRTRRPQPRRQPPRAVRTAADAARGNRAQPTRRVDWHRRFHPGDQGRAGKSVVPMRDCPAVCATCTFRENSSCWMRSSTGASTSSCSRKVFARRDVRSPAACAIPSAGQGSSSPAESFRCSSTQRAASEYPVRHRPGGHNRSRPSSFPLRTSAALPSSAGRC